MSFAEYQEGCNNSISEYRFAKFIELCLGEMLDSYARETTREAVDLMRYNDTEDNKEQMRRLTDKVFTVNRMAELSEKYKISVFAEEIAEEKK